MAISKTLILIWVIAFSIPLALCDPTGEIFFEGFKSAGANMTLDGAAKIESNGALKLTNDALRVLGHAFYRSPVRFRRSGKALSFSTAFAFAIVPEYPRLGGHGLAFALSPTIGLPGALPSQYLGLLNSTDMGNSTNHVFAVEFDTVQDFEFGDIDDNHVGIDVNSLASKGSAPAGFLNKNSSIEALNLKSGKVIQAWIDYDSGKKQINVTLSLSSTKPESPILSQDIDLSPIIGDFMYVGFSASTGLLASTHYVLGWSLKIEGEAKSLPLTSLPKIKTPKKNRTAVIAGASVSAALALFLVIALSVYSVRRLKNADVVEPWELDIGPHRFSYSELERATGGFSHLIGSGGFGQVYRGTLQGTKTEVAVKRISHESKQGIQEFASEIETIGRLRHRNLVQLLGWCRRRSDLLLVYDFMPNGSLDSYIFGDDPKSGLSWEQRIKIVKNVALGLLYLHEEWEQVVIHRDVKSGNVLLDRDLSGRLGDFGLAKLHERGSNPGTTRIVGTLGYLAPELSRTGRPSASSDVFAFGALLLEVVCGRRPVENRAAPEEIVLLDLVWGKWVGGSVLEVVDRRLGGEFEESEALAALKLGIMCSNGSPEMRPTMREVVRYLEGEAALPEVVPAPEGFDRRKGVGTEFEDFVHSYPASGCFEKATASLESSDNDDDEYDIEAELPLSGKGDGR